MGSGFLRRWLGPFVVEGPWLFSFYFACPFWKFRWSNCNYPIVSLVGYLVVVVAVVGACMKLEKFLSGRRLCLFCFFGPSRSHPLSQVIAIIALSISNWDKKKKKKEKQNSKDYLI